jgi:hypothetical protein
MAVVITGVFGVVGVAHLSPLWLFLLVCALGAISFLTVRAFSVDTKENEISALRGALGFSLALLVGIYFYHLWGDPEHKVSRYVWIVNGSDSNLLQPYSEPGGPTILDSPLIGGHPYDFQCIIRLPDGSTWLKRDDYWYPTLLLHRPRGVNPPSTPTCQS